MRIQGILFDMDGTLLDTLTDMQKAVNYVLEAFGYPLRSREEVRAFVGNGAARLIHRVLPEGVMPEWEAAVLAAYKRRYQDYSCVETAPYEGIPALLAELERRGIRMAVVSNKPDETTRSLAARFFPGLAAQGQRDGIAAKPAPDMVYAALEQLGLRPEETVYVGDSEVDVETARNAGLPVIGVAWGFRGRAALLAAGAQTVAGTAAELLEQEEN